MNYSLRRHPFSIIVVALLLVALTPPLKAVTYVEASQSQGSFSDGFESRDFSAWSGVALTSGDNATVGASNPYAGSCSALFQTGGIASGTRKASVYENIGSSTDIYARGYFQITNGLPLDDDGDRFVLIAFVVGSTTLASFRVYHTNGVDKFNIIGYNGTSNYPSQSTDTIYPAQGRWYCIEFYAKIHNAQGEYHAWINGTERLSITGVNSAVLGNITTVDWGIPLSINVQHPVNVFGDCAEINNVYIGTLNEAFGVVGSTTVNPAVTNFYWLFGNESISYSTMLPSNVQDITNINRFKSLVLWTKQAGYNVTAVKQYATTHIVITDMKEFCTVLYPTLNTSLQTVSTSTVTYAVDWGDFHAGDLVEMRNETGNTDRLTTVLSSSLTSSGNTTIIARLDTGRIAIFHMNGSQAESGFYVMDLDATTPDTAKTGIWHVFPAVKMVQDFPTGQYAAWMANGQQWWNLTWIYNRIDTLVNENPDIANKQVIGYSVLGRAIPAILIGKGAKNAIIDGSIHGDEKTGTFACLRLAELLINYYETDPIWRSRLTEFKVIIVPVLNPDGFANNVRENANGVDLNEQFPPDGAPTQPEAFALMNLMGNYTPSVYVNMHEGYYWYPSDMLYGNYETGAGKSATIGAMQQANETFATLNHYGRFTESGSNVWIGSFRAIYQSGKWGMTVSYASYKYHASCMLIETFMWSLTWGARESLWGLDCYCATSLGFLAAHAHASSGSTQFLDGFESGDFSTWTGTYVTSGETVTVVGTLPYQGNYSAKFTSNGTGGFEAAYSYESVPTSLKLYAEGCFYVSQSGIADNDDRFYFIKFSSGTNDVACAGWRRTGGVDRWDLVVRDATGWAIVDSNSSLSLNKWYYLELYWVEGATNGHGELYVNGALACSIRDENTTAFGGIDQVRFGLPEIYSSGPTTVYTDFCRILGAPPWDLNQDGKVNLTDVSIVTMKYGSNIGSLNWNPLADINADGKVNLIDVMMVAMHFGEQYA